jgi:ATP-binding cassette subfamily F protein 3
MALNEFEGTVMLVSHDRALLRAVCDEFWMVGRGAVGPFDGDLDDYQRYLLDEAKRQRELAKAEAASEQRTAPVSAAAPLPAIAKPLTDSKPAVDGKGQRKQDAQARQQLTEKLRPYKRELEQIDKRISELTEQRRELEAQLTQALPPAEIADCGRRLKAASDETQALEERWLELSSQLEAVSASA